MKKKKEKEKEGKREGRRSKEGGGEELKRAGRLLLCSLSSLLLPSLPPSSLSSPLPPVFFLTHKVSILILKTHLIHEKPPCDSEGERWFILLKKKSSLSMSSNLRPSPKHPKAKSRVTIAPSSRLALCTPGWLPLAVRAHWLPASAEPVQHSRCCQGCLWAGDKENKCC